MSIAVVGALAFDDIETPAAAVRDVLGGSAAYVALAAALLTPVHVISVVGDDCPPERLEPLRRPGVDLAGVSVVPGRTFRWSCRYGADLDRRDTLRTDPGVFRSAAVRVPASAAGATHVFLTTGEPRQSRAALPAFSRRQVTMLDTIEREILHERAALLESLRQADIVSINEAEAALLRGHAPGGADAAAEVTQRFLRAYGPSTLLLKRGPRGVDVVQDGTRTRIAAVPEVTVVDPTGAGDSFAGGTLSALARGASLDDAARWGCAVASFAVEGFGLDGLLRATLELVLERAESIGLGAGWRPLVTEGAAS
ncbi:MAG: PfkB family carbohydrate kinase [Dehalococcoidia bacterium]